ncbi:MAG TPA: hypothetical protein VE869_01475 [Gemmatimonas sp.]|nr:hypothetical protein [Gemmatimonas sp.]
MSVTMIVRHPVTDYATWRAVYDSAAVIALHAKHGITSSEVLQAPGDANDVVVINRFASAEAANALASDPELKMAMEKGGVAGPPRIEIFTNV